MYTSALLYCSSSNNESAKYTSSWYLFTMLLSPYLSWVPCSVADNKKLAWKGGNMLSDKYQSVITLTCIYSCLNYTTPCNIIVILFSYNWALAHQYMTVVYLINCICIRTTCGPIWKQLDEKNFKNSQNNNYWTRL